MRARAGFTLVELLISIAIIGLLIGILLPALGYARRMGQDAVCRSHLREIARCFHLYAEKNHGSAPDENNLVVSWDEQLKPFIPDKDIYLCPGDKTAMSRAIGFSYTWRNSIEVTNPRASISRVDLRAAAPGDLVLIFEVEHNWHRFDSINASLLGTSAHSFTSQQFTDDLDRPVQ